jgi:hypothetical protein
MVRFSQVIEQEKRRWMPFRRALAKEDQGACERMFECAKQQLEAEVQLGRPWSFEAVILAVLLEHEKRVEEMLRRLADGREGRGQGSPWVARQGATPRGDTRHISLF